MMYLRPNIYMLCIWCIEAKGNRRGAILSVFAVMSINMLLLCCVVMSLYVKNGNM